MPEFGQAQHVLRDDIQHGPAVGLRDAIVVDVGGVLLFVPAGNNRPNCFLELIVGDLVRLESCPESKHSRANAPPTALPEAGPSRLRSRSPCAPPFSGTSRARCRTRDPAARPTAEAPASRNLAVNHRPCPTNRSIRSMIDPSHTDHHPDSILHRKADIQY